PAHRDTCALSHHRMRGIRQWQCPDRVIGVDGHPLESPLEQFPHGPVLEDVLLLSLCHCHPLPPRVLPQPGQVQVFNDML
ncbi:hypothetical protein O3P69_012049, partial [Scylla paramamosain]